MGQLRDKMKHDLELAGLQPKTQLIYLNAIRDFAAFHRRSPAELGADDARAWVAELTKPGGWDRNASGSTWRR